MKVIPFCISLNSFNIAPSLSVKLFSRSGRRYFNNFAGDLNHLISNIKQGRNVHNLVRYYFTSRFIQRKKYINPGLSDPLKRRMFDNEPTKSIEDNGISIPDLEFISTIVPETMKQEYIDKKRKNNKEKGIKATYESEMEEEQEEEESLLRLDENYFESMNENEFENILEKEGVLERIEKEKFYLENFMDTRNNFIVEETKKTNLKLGSNKKSDNLESRKIQNDDHENKDSSHRTKQDFQSKSSSISNLPLISFKTKSGSKDPLEFVQAPVIDDRKPLVAIIGRPNVGKSTLFNRLIRKSRSLITSKAGTTRDRKYGITEHNDYSISMIDTGGILGCDEWSESIQTQALIAIEEADIIVFIVDYEKGLDINDIKLARIIRKKVENVIVVINKCDNNKRAEDFEVQKLFDRLDFGKAIPISATHGLGTEKVLDTIVEYIKKMGKFMSISEQRDLKKSEYDSYEKEIFPNVTSGAFLPDGTRKEIRVSIIGVPNAGKSSLLNQILKKERSIVSPIAGTTTDPIDEKIVWKKKYPIILIDTAGIRRRKSQKGDIEKLSALWSLKSISSSHVVILMFDASIGVFAQDIKLSSYVIENYKSCLVVVNKWDLSPDPSIMGMQTYEESLRRNFQFWNHIPILFASAKTGANVENIMSWVIKISDERQIRLGTQRLIQILEQANFVKAPPSKGKKKLKIKFATQANIGGSPTFVFFANYPELVNDNYRRFLDSFIRKHHSFTGTPIRLIFRKNFQRSNK